MMFKSTLNRTHLHIPINVFMAFFNQNDGTHFLQMYFSQHQFHCCGVDIAGDWAKHNER